MRANGIFDCDFDIILVNKVKLVTFINLVKLELIFPYLGNRYLTLFKLATYDIPILIEATKDSIEIDMCLP